MRFFRYSFILVLILFIPFSSIGQNPPSASETQNAHIRYFQGLAWWYDYGNEITKQEAQTLPSFYVGYFDQNDDVKRLEYYHDGKLGFVKLYGERRIILKIEMYKDGAKHGNWFYYDYINNDRVISKVENYVNGELNTVRKFAYDGLGRKTREENYKANDVKDGLFEYYEDGKIQKVEIYRNDAKIGVWLYYNENGRVKRVEKYFDGQMTENTVTSEVTEYEEVIQDASIPYNIRIERIEDPAGYTLRYFRTDQPSILLKEERYNKNDLKNGLWSYYDETGRLIKTEDYRKDVRNGIWKNYTYIKGKRQVQQLIQFKDGETRKVTNYEYYPSGIRKSEINSLDGLLHGVQREYLENGKIKMIGEYYKDLKNGFFYEFEYFNGEGVIIRKEEYFDDNLDGERLDYTYNTDMNRIILVEKGVYKDGALQERGLYDRGIIQEKEFFDDNNNVVKREFYENGELQKSRTY